MASKVPRSKPDHETRGAKRHKAHEAPREPRRPKTHWDYVLEEMLWLSKDFEAERKWKLAQAKKVAIRASKNALDPATRGEKKVKEEEQRLRKVALNISKDVKKFWMKIEKLVLYKHQLELEEKKKKALDKQLDFLLGQTERYSTMLAENLVDMPSPCKPVCPDSAMEQLNDQDKEEVGTEVVESPKLNGLSTDDMDVDGDYDIQPEAELDDDEHTIEEDEFHITANERQAELEALQDEMDKPLEEVLKRYSSQTVSNKGSPSNDEDIAEETQEEENLTEGTENSLFVGDAGDSYVTGHQTDASNGNMSPDNCKADVDLHQAKNQLKECKKLEKQELVTCNDEQEDGDYILAAEEEKDDEGTLSEEEEMAKDEGDNPLNEIELLKKESEMSVEELLARYTQDLNSDEDADDADDESSYASTSSEDLVESPATQYTELERQASPMKDVAVEPDELDEFKQISNHDANLSEVEPEMKSDESKGNEDRIASAAAAARSAQPTGNTFSTMKVRTTSPFLLKHDLREYQHIGLDWLVTMYEKRLNGILADEMGLGKTIMTISLLAHLACEKGIWGPHLIVVPTSVMLNWETEFLKWCPAFKILTYFGSAKERKFKRQGWMKPNFFHVCITTYRLVIQDSKAFKRKKWKYLILDEAHLIKNWKSQRWQTLLNFNSKRRILLTGTPLQNDLMELWSLMHFLMPHIFQSHQEFKDWFSNPISGMVEGQEKVNKEVIDRLHNVLRPFILRRLKRDVEKQLPGKYEHVIFCRLSRRQRNLYEDFIASSETQATLANANFFGMISVIMQLRKVCNHPDLFEGRPIVSSFDMSGIELKLSSSVCMMLLSGPFASVDLSGLGLLFTHLDFSMSSWESDEVTAISTPSTLMKECASLESIGRIGAQQRPNDNRRRAHGSSIFEEIQKALWKERIKEAKERAESISWWNSLQCRKKPMYGTNLKDSVTVKHPSFDIHYQKTNPSCYLNFSSKLADIVLSPIERFQRMSKLIECFMFAIPAARAPSPLCWCSKNEAPVFLHPSYKTKCTEVLAPLLSPVRPAIVRRQVYFPDRRLIQFDCGKLQELAVLLRRLKSEGHRALIFTQMTKMLDILEAFINLYGYTYMRLDGSTQPEERQTLMQRFNTNPKIFLFILSTRSGGVGINLVGADTVIFYDSDWNPAMDQQAQDRCHRIGQTREVHIYRLISESTIEENILKKANQKRALDDLVIQNGSYNTEFFKKLDPLELFSGHREISIKSVPREKNLDHGVDNLLSNDDVEAALKHAEDEADYMALKKVEEEEAVDNQEFTDEAILRLEDDEFVNEDDLKFDEKSSGDQTGWITVAEKDVGTSLNGSGQHEGRALTLPGKEEDFDMLADVKQLAAAAAAGQASSSFEYQLRPIDRYAMRFLDLWDPVIDKSAMESQVNFEEREWELDRIEKFKEDLEAEIDDDEEPLIYERWDAEFATKAYNEEVKALTQRQLLEDLECEAREAEETADADCEAARLEMLTEAKPKSKKKTKKKKFKSLKKEALACQPEAAQEEPSFETMSFDYEDISSEMADLSDFVPSESPIKRKRKKAQGALEVDEEKRKSKKSKKNKKDKNKSSLFGLDSKMDKQYNEGKESKGSDIVVKDFDHKPMSRSKMGGKISIAAMPVKRILVIKPEKLNKKGSIWSRGWNVSPDSWSSQEDVILCAVVHEYGPNWSLVSDVLYGMTAGGFYRGRFHHLVHCCERFRELFQRFVKSATENQKNEKVSNTGPGKSVLRATEDNMRTLLDVASDLPDNELLLQRHFTAVISSVWRARSLAGCLQGMSSSFDNIYYRKSTQEPLRNFNFAVSCQSSKLVSTALYDADSKQLNVIMPSRQRTEASEEVERLDITLEFHSAEDPTISLPSSIYLSICGPDPPLSANESNGGLLPLGSCFNSTEKPFRMASETCFDGASSAFSSGELIRSRSTSKQQSLGKNKAPMSDSIMPSKSKLARISTESSEEHPISKLVFPSPRSVAQDIEYSRLICDSICDDDKANNSYHDRMNDSLMCDMDIFNAVPHHFDPDFFSGLEDCTILPEFIDIG
ncbi:Photoperiod-independent early flowering 1-like [Thalictrum thalictroides]|uniref:DNA helicase n=1 Tax=Thalictrum thalictroides TaxID=46969 RepID=A0A7J6WD92_THATH|nr:Photoperiod-independent early flowering 1-like [Thalictrum thalictroides]